MVESSGRANVTFFSSGISASRLVDGSVDSTLTSMVAGDDSISNVSCLESGTGSFGSFSEAGWVDSESIVGCGVLTSVGLASVEFSFWASTAGSSVVTTTGSSSVCFSSARIAVGSGSAGVRISL
ncbi:hypothetical protein WICPIJ_000385 [Wickerhamomyces pijperi]|uniref:Uncharacterized protein n=1 Tax=Wickerhamomyces pijperi TaxID=599730 RepID=A0A9P8QDR9_WICPI|nr:hypothetical protein WICPIJ_000385 [Wickerhamomyces pijperi]